MPAKPASDPADSLVVFLVGGLRARRITAKRSQEDIAKEIGVSIDMYRRWESHKAEPTLSSFQRWARVLGGSITPRVELPEVLLK